MSKLLSILSVAVLLAIGSTQGTWAQQPNFYELGTYPGGTWFTTQSVNELGVVVGRGDVPSGYIHTLAVPLFGPYAGQWIDLGALGGVQPTGFEYEALTQISDTGLVVSHSTAGDGYEHAVAWTRETGMVDLGTLAATGDPLYATYIASYAYGTNKLGTLIAGSGWSPEASKGWPAVWTLSFKWKGGKFVTNWKIQALDLSAVPGLTRGVAWGVNDYGQIIGTGFNDDFTVMTALLWNPRPDGKGWMMMSLPPSALPASQAYSINDRGEIVGVANSADQSIWLPQFWKPTDKKRTTYSQPIELALPSGFTSCESVGINDMGDIVGDCWNDTQDLPARWITALPTFSELIKFPGSFGYSWCVTNNRIAAVTYNGSKCPTDDTTCGGAIKLHSLR
jgi:probable HAF family extracellular repeat protein